MENEWPIFSDTRPVVAFVVLCAALSCCCLLAGSTALASHWWTSRSFTPTALPASPAGFLFERHSKYVSDPRPVSILKKDRAETIDLALDRPAAPVPIAPRLDAVAESIPDR
jgi:hypothetical protein